jgi:peptidoglycan/xylan/chitin deacetylase (PgdA/CDA1 family)
MIGLMRARTLAGGVVAVSAAGWSAPALAPVVPVAATALHIPTRSALLGTVALTFDDGPHPAGTPAVLDALATEGVRATFFLVGEQVLRSPGLAGEVAAAGHAVAIHGHRHRNLLRVGRRALADDLDRAAEAIARHAGVVATLHRPPYGIYSHTALRAVRDRGWSPVLWSRWGRDWRRRATAPSIASELTGRVGEGDVLLLHDADDYGAPGSWRTTAAALPWVLEAVARRGLTFAPIAAAGDLAHTPGW